MVGHLVLVQGIGVRIPAPEPSIAVIRATDGNPTNNYLDNKPRWLHLICR